MKITEYEALLIAEAMMDNGYLVDSQHLAAKTGELLSPIEATQRLLLNAAIIFEAREKAKAAKR